LLVSILTCVSLNLAHTGTADLRMRLPILLTGTLIICAKGIIEALFQLFLSCRETF